MNKIPYGRHNITENDIQAVVEVLKSDWLTQGPKVGEFEQEFAKYIGVKYAVAVSNGTAALHLSAMALGLETGDQVITTPITFSATANCIRYCGGEVVFADINQESYLLELKEVKKILKASPKGKIKGIIPVDFAGRAVNMEALKNVADEFGCWIIEDACHAPGGYFTDYAGVKHYCGNCDFSDLAVFSFHPVKHIACGEGGMITTNNEELYHKLRMLRSHGIQQRQNFMQQNHGVWYYEMQELGYNYRLTDIQAALAISQLSRANEGLKKRFEIASNYEKSFRDLEFIKGQTGLVDGHAYHLYVIEIERRKELIDFLRTCNIYAQVHYIPVHLMPYYRQYGWEEGILPISEEYYRRCLSIPIFPTLTSDQQFFVIESIKTFYNE